MSNHGKEVDQSSAMSSEDGHSFNTRNQSDGYERGSKRQRKHRRMANEIQKDFKCLHCDKTFGTEAATVLHMRFKHQEGTKQEIE